MAISHKLIELEAREWDVLKQLADGFSNPEIASNLNLNKHTLVSVVSKLFKKLGIRRRAEVPSVLLLEDIKFKIKQQKK